MWVEKHRKTWRIREELPDGRKIDLKTGFLTKSAADDALILMKAEQLLGTALVPRGGERTLRQFCTQWWEYVEETYTKVRTRESIEGVMDRYIIRMLGDYKLRELEESPALVQRWVKDMMRGRTKVPKPKPLSAKTIRNAHGLLSQLMSVAIDDRLIRSNPCAKTWLPDEEDTEQYYMTPAEADRLIAALPEHWRPLVLFLLATGCRFSEARGLRAKNLDVLARKVRILKKTVEDRHGHFHDEDPKSRRGRRTISFTAKVAETLIPLAMADDDRERRIFLGPRGGIPRHKDFYKVWNQARDDAGLKDLRVHDLRHTHVAWLIAAKIPLSAISRRLGHKSISVTDDIYGHLMEEVNEQIVAALDDAMEVIDMGGIWGETAEDEDRSEPVDADEDRAK